MTEGDKNMLRNGVMAVKERVMHPERFSRDGFRQPVSVMKHHKVLTPKERIAARLQLVVWLKELEHELIRETLADGEGLLAAKVAKAEVEGANEETGK